MAYFGDFAFHAGSMKIMHQIIINFCTIICSVISRQSCIILEGISLYADLKYALAYDIIQHSPILENNRAAKANTNLSAILLSYVAIHC